MPKVLRILNRFNVGGPIYNVAYLTKHIHPDYTTILIGGEKNDNEASSEYVLQNLDISYTIIPEMKRRIGFFGEFKALWKIIQVIKKEKPDIVHTHAAKAGTLGRIAAWVCGVPIIVHTFHGHVFHSYFGKVKTRIFIIIEQFLASLSTAIVAISDIQKQELGSIYKICKPSKIHVIPLGFDLQKFEENLEFKRTQFRSTYNIQENEIAIGIVGRLVPVKNHALFIESIAECAKKTDKKIRAFIIGDGELLTELQNTCTTQQIPWGLENDNALITFTSWISDVDRAYAGLDIVCLSSYNEGTPVSLIEAQVAGKPIITTNVGGILNVVSENKTALVSDTNLQNYSTNLFELIQNDELREQMAKNAQQFSKDTFSYQRLCNDMYQLYNHLQNK